MLVYRQRLENCSHTWKYFESHIWCDLSSSLISPSNGARLDQFSPFLASDFGPFSKTVSNIYSSRRLDPTNTLALFNYAPQPSCTACSQIYRILSWKLQIWYFIFVCFPFRSPRFFPSSERAGLSPRRDSCVARLKTHILKRFVHDLWTAVYM